jgi:hypothetical protein
MPLLEQGFQRGAGPGLVRDVEGDGSCAAARRQDLGHDRCGRLLILVRVNVYFMAVRREASADRRADAAAAARDDRPLPR